jgi:hypothetical protein
MVNAAGLLGACGPGEESAYLRFSFQQVRALLCGSMLPARNGDAQYHHLRPDAASERNRCSADLQQEL